MAFPEPFQNLNWIQRLCIFRTFKPELIFRTLNDFVTAELGEKFTVPPPFHIQSSFEDSESAIPLIFILPGYDPLVPLQNFAENQNK